MNDLNVVSKYRWCLSNEPDLLGSVPRITLELFKINGNQQLHYLSNILGFGNVIAGSVIQPFGPAQIGAVYETAAGGVTELLETSGSSSGSPRPVNTSSREDSYRNLYNLEDLKTTITLPYFTESAVSTSSQWTEKVTEEATSLIASVMDSGIKSIGSAVTAAGGVAGAVAGNYIKGFKGMSKMKGGSAAAVAAGAASVAGAVKALAGSIGYKGIDDLTRSLIRSKAGGNAPYAGVEQPLYYNGTTRTEINVNFPLYNIFGDAHAIANYDLIQKLLYYSLKDRQSFFAYDSPYVCKVYDDARSTFYRRPLMFISKLDVKNVGIVRRVVLNGIKTTIPEAYVVSLSLTEMVPASKNTLEASWMRQDIIRTKAK